MIPPVMTGLEEWSSSGVVVSNYNQWETEFGLSTDCGGTSITDRSVEACVAIGTRVTVDRSRHEF